ncbi:MAG: hypothetical protein IKT80_06895 [Bacteroidaceae bacterium]|nr:hypothetical protein [Bacteroidaceae bacterium]
MSAYLHYALHALKEATKGIILDLHLEKVERTIQTCAITAAATGIGAGMFPGTGGIVLTAASVTAIWTMYVRINKILEISIADNILKSLASAMLTNIIAAGGAYILAVVATVVIAFIPGLHFLAAPAEAIIAYIAVFASGILYIKFLTNIFKAKGAFDFGSGSDVQQNVKDIINNTDMSSMIKDVKESYQQNKEEIAKEKNRNK